MLALWLEDGNLQVRADLPVPAPQPDEALIRVTLAGICATDLEMVKGYYPYTGIPGHEFVGVVEEATRDSTWVGKRVVGEINITCGECPPCRRGHPTHCQFRTAIGINGHHGAFAQFLCLPIRNLHQVPDSVPDEVAVFVEPLAAALEILEQVDIRAGDRVLVVGAGRLGQLVARVLALHGCRLTVVIRHPNQRELLDGVGIATILETQVPKDEMDVVVEATGSPGGFALAAKAVRPRGKIVLKSTYAGSQGVNLSPVVVDEITLVGSRCGPFTPALELLEVQKVDPTPLISSRFGIEAGIEAFSHASESGVFKVLLDTR